MSEGKGPQGWEALSRGEELAGRRTGRKTRLFLNSLYDSGQPEDPWQPRRRLPTTPTGTWGHEHPSHTTGSGGRGHRTRVSGILAQRSVRPGAGTASALWVSRET